MRKSLLGLLGLVCISSADVLLTFQNGDTLAGNLQSGTGDSLTLEAEFLKKPAKLRTNGLLHLEQTSTAQLLPSGHTAEVTFNKGGIIYGALAQLEEDSLTLQTGYAGEVTLPRAMIRTLTISRQGRSIYQGPSPLESWNTLEGVWEKEVSGISSKGAAAIAREVSFPDDRFSLEWTLAWTNSPQMALMFLTDTTESASPANCFELSLRGNRAVLHKIKVTEQGRQQRVQIGETVLPIFRQRLMQADLKLDLDRISGDILFHLNGVQLARWSDPDPKGTFPGSGLLLQAYNQEMTVLSLAVREWDGSTDRSDTRPDLPVSITEDEQSRGFQQITLRNGDIVIGKVDQLDTNAVTLTTDEGVVVVPLQRMTSVALRGLRENEYDEAIRLKGDVTGHYPNGESLTFQLKSLDGMKAQAFSQNFGDTEIDLRVFTKIDFNLYDPELIAARRRSSEP